MKEPCGGSLRQDVLDALFGGDFPPPALYSVLGSTNNQAKELGFSSAPEFTAVLAARQEQGRGRLGRPFFSPEGSGLYLSVLLRPHLPPECFPLLTPFTAVAVCRALCALFPGIEPEIKWVNDIYLHGKKLCGILVESVLGASPFAVVGIGVNVGKIDFPAPLEKIATSLANEGYRCDFPRERLAAGILRELCSYETALTGGRDVLYEAYRKRQFLIGRRVAVYGVDGGYLFTGTVEGLTKEFSLAVRGEDGAAHLLTAGEVSLKPDTAADAKADT